MARGPLLLRDRDMLLVWSGQSLSQAGTRLYQIALAWWIVSRGGGGQGAAVLGGRACSSPAGG
ncbi:MAG: hypothetical protein AAB576_02185, partial [Elusimicrobiota bacterium]